VLTEHLDPESQAHFAELRAGLDALGIPYTVNPRLVRGLDYYSRTVFEWITDALGSQDAVCSGGRYDGLIAQMGGEPTPAIGYAMGVERVVELVKLAGVTPPATVPDVFVMAQGDAAQRSALALAESLRDQFPGRGIVVHCGSAKFKTQFRRADESGARIALVIGDDELARGVVALKPLHGAETTQSEHPLAEVGARVDEFLRRST
jgi:histidyl-tRNA synthetase